MHHSTDVQNDRIYLGSQTVSQHILIIIISIFRALAVPFSSENSVMCACGANWGGKFRLGVSHDYEDVCEYTLACKCRGRAARDGVLVGIGGRAECDDDNAERDNCHEGVDDHQRYAESR